MTNQAIQQEALSRAENGITMSNYPAIFAGFMARGIPEEQIIPRVNVLSFQAWKAKKRFVRKGEHGVKIATVRHGIKKDDKTGQEKTYSFPWTVAVFHISQTEPIEQKAETHE